jgi:phosphate-selective porin OprO/OprP
MAPASLASLRAVTALALALWLLAPLTACAEVAPVMLIDPGDSGDVRFALVAAEIAEQPMPLVASDSTADSALGSVSSGGEPNADPPLADQVRKLQAELEALQESLDKKSEDAEKKAEAKKADEARVPTAILSTQFQADFYAIDQDAANQAAFGDIQNGEAFRRARIGVFGDHGPTEYRIDVDFALSSRPSFLDVWAGLKDIPGVGRVRVGHFFEPFSLERLTSNRFVTFMERSLPDQAFVPARNMGVAATNNWCGEDATWAVGYFRTDSDPLGDDTGDDFQSAVTGRVTLLPWYDTASKGRRLMHVGVAGSLRGAAEDRARFRSQPEARIGATTPNIPFFADTGVLLTEEIQLLGFEAALVEGAASLQTEYVAANAALAGGDVTFDSFYVTASYFLTGEHRPYRRDFAVFDRVQPLRPAVRYTGDSKRVCLGPGAWEIAARVSRLDLNEGPVAGGQMDNFTLGLNWYLTPYLRWTGNWVHSLVDRAPTGESSADLFGMRVSYEF